jgi:uncharacterized membrane protein YphA (DoxX/SURF4 family)
MLTFLLVLLTPLPLLAHTRWFAQGTVQPYVGNEPLGLYLLMWGCIVSGVVAAGFFLDRRRMVSLNFLRPHAPHQFERAAAVFSMVAGAFLLIAGTHYYLFSPNLSVESGAPMVFVTLQVLIGISFLIGAFARVSALLLGLLWVCAIPFVGVEASLENVWVLSTALFILIMGNDYFALMKFPTLAHLVQPYRSYALPLLRLGTGATLLILGFSEKILRPEFGLHFLEQYHWNFMHLLGFNYSDYLFTISAGAVEALFGLIFILGIMTRLNALALAVFFTIPLFLLGPIELSGHLPHLAAVAVLLFFGGGERLRMCHGRF